VHVIDERHQSAVTRELLIWLGLASPVPLVLTLVLD